ncbi:nuclear transport factor 2 family protein [Kutzneria sp. CA-103260]|uniref:nuclear transport factor 2 family protein n=1 Tax=Kutzneria sp. CA-103260 TaxID=2802641 RepID=UPI001BED538A|nr:nuclear transport factor 2 family protein [Kutzneria sp. CA-103260]QUQ65711.1 SnoaL-like domain protein [Kutzneria sp. CA-103260]
MDNGSALKIAEEYGRAWVSGDVEKALSLVADDVVCQAPRRRVVGMEGVGGYREFLATFVADMISGELIDVLGDDDRAAVVSITQMRYVADYRSVEYITVRDGKINYLISVFDREPIPQSSRTPKTPA